MDVPETPQDPNRYWKAVTVDNTHHVFGDLQTHLEKVEDLGKTPSDVQHYWGWNPYQNRWETFDRLGPEYQRAWDLNHGDDWHFGAALEDWGDDYDQGFRERALNPHSDESIRELLSPVPKRGTAQKGIQLPEGPRYFWTPDEYGFPHHDNVAGALGVTEGMKYLETDEQGNVSDAHDYQNPDFWKL